MAIGERKSLSLTAAQRAALTAAVAKQLPSFAPRMATVETDVVEQPFFATTRILDVTSAVPSPSRIYVSWRQDKFLVLTDHIEHLNQTAAADVPQGLEDPKLATEYLTYADAWTTASTGRELRLESVDDIPWWEYLDDDQKAQIEEVKQAFGDKIAPQALFMAFPKYELHLWFLITQALVERELSVSMQGAFARTSKIHRHSLPVPPGQIWGHVNGRFVPVG